MPASATLRNIEFLGRLSTPSASVPEVQNFFSTVRAWVRMRDCSKYFMKKMYQVPADMIARITRMVIETGLCSWTMCSRPYGFCGAAPVLTGGLTAGLAGTGAGIAAGAGAAAPPGAAIVGSAGGALWARTGLAPRPAIR